MSDDAPDIWPLVTRPDGEPPGADIAALRAAAGRFAAVASPVLAEFLLAPAAGRLGAALIDEADSRASRLANRFALAQQRRWAAAIADGGIEAAFIKGFANAHTLYPEAELRTQGDLDVLVRASDRDRLVALLTGHGFRFRPSPTGAWGMISDASYMPFVSPDGACDIDIHIHPDAYPAHRSLDTARLFAAARHVAVGDGSILVPSAEHALVLCVTNTAKDKFGVFSVRKVLDAIVLLRGTDGLDWDEVRALGRDGGFAKPMRAFFQLLVRLGHPAASLPASLLSPPLGGIAGRELDRAARDFAALFPGEPSLAGLLRRELALCAEFPVALHNFGLRLAGLVRRPDGIPPGGRLEPARGQE